MGDFLEDTACDKVTLQLAIDCLSKNNTETARELLKGLSERADTITIFSEDGKSRYFDFNEPFEEVLYKYRNPDHKEVRYVGWMFLDVYYLYGSLLLKEKRYEEAAEALQKALSWNPAHAGTYFELAEIEKARDGMEEFLSLTQKASDFSFTKENVARCLRNYGYYFVEKEEWEAAKACYSLSLLYDAKAENAKKELSAIRKKGKGWEKDFSGEELRALSEQYGFPMGVQISMPGIATTLGTREYEAGNYLQAEYFLGIVDAFVNLPQIKTMLKECRKRQKDVSK